MIGKDLDSGFDAALLEQACDGVSDDTLPGWQLVELAARVAPGTTGFLAATLASGSKTACDEAIASIDSAIEDGGKLSGLQGEDARRYTTAIRIIAETCPIQTLATFYARADVSEFMR